MYWHPNNNWSGVVGKKTRHALSFESFCLFDSSCKQNTLSHTNLMNAMSASENVHAWIGLGALTRTPHMSARLSCSSYSTVCGWGMPIFFLVSFHFILFLFYSLFHSMHVLLFLCCCCLTTMLLLSSLSAVCSFACSFVFVLLLTQSMYFSLSSSLSSSLCVLCMFEYLCIAQS